MDESIYDLAGAAQYLGMTTRKLKDLCRDKRIAHSRLDYRSYRFRRSDLEGYLETYKFRRCDVTPSFQPSASGSLSRLVDNPSMTIPRQLLEKICVVEGARCGYGHRPPITLAWSRTDLQAGPLRNFSGSRKRPCRQGSEKCLLSRPLSDIETNRCVRSASITP